MVTDIESSVDRMSWQLCAPNKGVTISFTIGFSITMSVHMVQAMFVSVLRHRTFGLRLMMDDTRP